MSTRQKIIAGIIGLIAGTIGSLIAPWVQWAVKKCEMRQRRRIELVKTWKSILDKANFDRKNLLADSSYSTLKPLLTEKARKEIERPATSFHIKIGGSPTDYDKDLILEEIGRIEKDWKLI